MSVLCPECRKSVDLVSARCAGGHRFPLADGVVSLLSSARRDELDHYLVDFEKWREDRGDFICDPMVYQRLPEAPQGADYGMWKLRALDLLLMRRRLRHRPQQRILEIGAWNGWLSHQLSLEGHDLLAVDYFVHPFDGLRARKHYPGAVWQAIQMDLEDLSILEGPFDVIVFNRGLPTFSDPVRTVRHATTLLAPGGFVICTGLNVFKRTTEIEAHFAGVRKDFERSTGRDLFFKPMKGYLDNSDVDRLSSTGLRIHTDRRLWRSNLRARLFPSSPMHCWGVVFKQE